MVEMTQKVGVRSGLVVFLLAALSACTGDPDTPSSAKEGETVLTRADSALPPSDSVKAARAKSGETPLFPPAGKRYGASAGSLADGAGLNPPTPPSGGRALSLKSETAEGFSMTPASTENGDPSALTASASGAITGGDTLTLSPEVPAPPLTADAVLHSPLWQEIGGSNIYTNYMASSFIYWDEKFKKARGKAGKRWSFLCEDPSCSKGIKNMSDLTPGNMIQATHYLGLNDEVYYVKEGRSLVLQGEPQNLEEVRNFIETLREQGHLQEGIKRVLVNLPYPWTDPRSIFELGLIIAQNEADIHIIGQCSDLCVHLLPAAKKVVIEPYGFLAYTGGYAELYRETGKILESNTAKMRERFHEDYFPSEDKREDFKKILNSVDSGLIDDILGFPLAVNALNRFVSRRAKDSFEELSEEERDHFINSLPEEAFFPMEVRIFETSAHHETILQTKRVITHQKMLAEQERLYYERLGVPPARPELWSYSGLVDLSARLVKLDLYEELFIENRMSLDIPEREKPYLAVLPSAEVLRRTGITVYGENTGKTLGYLYNGADEAFLPLDTKDIENCGLFHSSSYIFEEIQSCMAQNDKHLQLAEVKRETPPPNAEIPPN